MRPSPFRRQRAALPVTDLTSAKPLRPSEQPTEGTTTRTGAAIAIGTGGAGAGAPGASGTATRHHGGTPAAAAAAAAAAGVRRAEGTEGSWHKVTEEVEQLKEEQEEVRPSPLHLTARAALPVTDLTSCQTSSSTRAVRRGGPGATSRGMGGGRGRGDGREDDRGGRGRYDGRRSPSPGRGPRRPRRRSRSWSRSPDRDRGRGRGRGRWDDDREAGEYGGR